MLIVSLEVQNDICPSHKHMIGESRIRTDARLVVGDNLQAQPCKALSCPLLLEKYLYTPIVFFDLLPSNPYVNPPSSTNSTMSVTLTSDRMPAVHILHVAQIRSDMTLIRFSWDATSIKHETLTPLCVANVLRAYSREITQAQRANHTMPQQSNELMDQDIKVRTLAHRPCYKIPRASSNGKIFGVAVELNRNQKQRRRWRSIRSGLLQEHSL